MFSKVKRNVLLNLLHGFRPVSLEGLHTSRTLLERNYYDVLNLKKGCSSKEIRESFITLAKQFHPDANKNDPQSHARFIELQHAYSVLSSPSKRQNYDSGYSSGFTSNYESGPTIRKWSDYDDSKDYERHFDEDFKEYYYRSQQPREPNPPGIPGIKVTLYLLAFTAVGALVQYFVLRWIYDRSYKDELEQSKRAMASYYALKQEMDKRSEEYDIQKLRAAYFKEVKGLIGLHLVPQMIRPDVSPSYRQKEQNLPSQQVIKEDENPSLLQRKKEDPLPEK